MIKKASVSVLLLGAMMQLHAGDPLSVVREKGFYKTGAAAKNTRFVEWLKRPVFGPGSEASEANASGKNASSSGVFGLFGASNRKIPPSLQLLRDQGYKDKEARLNAKLRQKSQEGSR